MRLVKRRDTPSFRDVFEPIMETEETREATRDPAEVRIYLKALRRALKFLPLGSRAYYYVSGEIVRANRQLKGSPGEPGPSETRKPPTP
jgi:hypothetical protein